MINAIEELKKQRDEFKAEYVKLKAQAKKEKSLVTEGMALGALHCSALMSNRIVELMEAELKTNHKNITMTKVTILGHEPKEEKQLKPIEFLKFNAYEWGNGEWCRCDYNRGAKDWDEVILLEKNHRKIGMDLFLAKDKNISCLFLGHFNDGIV